MLDAACVLLCPLMRDSEILKAFGDDSVPFIYLLSKNAAFAEKRYLSRGRINGDVSVFPEVLHGTAHRWLREIHCLSNIYRPDDAPAFREAENRLEIHFP